MIDVNWEPGVALGGGDQVEVAQRVRELVELANEHLAAPYRFDRVISLKLHRGNAKAGTAYGSKMLISLNAEVFERHREFLDELVPHEVAHLIVAHLRHLGVVRDGKRRPRPLVASCSGSASRTRSARTHWS